MFKSLQTRTSGTGRLSYGALLGVLLRRGCSGGHAHRPVDDRTGEDGPLDASARDESLQRKLRTVDGLLFDVDGVLLDASEAYPVAIAAATRHFCRLVRPEATIPQVLPEETYRFKLAGGFNDEWDVTWAYCLWCLWNIDHPPGPSLPAFTEAVRQAGGGRKGALTVLRNGLGEAAAAIEAELSGGLPEELAMEYYGGREACRTLFGFAPRHYRGPGSWRAERLLVDVADLAPWQGRLGIYTGRSRAEAQWSLVRFGVVDLIPESRWVTASDGCQKPDPEGLRRLVAQIPLRFGLFVGDNVDDAETVRRYAQSRQPDEPELNFAGISQGSRAEEFRRALTDLGALLVVPDVPTLIRLLRTAREEARS